MQRYGFPSRASYYAHERETVKKLFAIVGQLCPFLHEALSSLSALTSKLKASTNDCIEFYFPFETCLERKQKCQTIHLRSKVEFEGDRLTYNSYWVEMFGIKGTDLQNKLIRRIHFDVAIPGVEKNKQEHPLYHVQFAGRSHEDVSQEFAEQMPLSYPRVPFMPFSIALFFTFAIRELGNDDLKNVVKLGAWRELVRKSEELMLVPFFTYLYKSWCDKRQDLFSDLYYESGD